jgi:hypothetical protein
MELSVTAGGVPEPDELLDELLLEELLLEELLELLLDELLLEVPTPDDPPPAPPPEEPELPPPQEASTSADSTQSQRAWSGVRMEQQSVWNRRSLPVSNGTAAGMLTKLARSRATGQHSVMHASSLHPVAPLQQT